MNKQERIDAYNDFMDPCVVKIPAETLDRLGFFTAPASTKYHGAYEGGLFDHSIAVSRALVDLTDKLGLEWCTPQSARVVGMYHDLCKVDNYVLDFESGKWKYNSDMIIPGHGDKSVILTQKYIRLTEEEIACIRWHMGAFESDTTMWKYYGQAIEAYPNVLYTHTADMIASKILRV